MALAATFAFGAAAMSGVAVGLSVSAQQQELKDRRREDGRARKAAAAAAEAVAHAPQPHPEATVGWKGFSMDEARVHADEEQKKVLAMAPRDVLAELQRGNTRFWMGHAVRPEKTAFERRALIAKQFPSVAILSCADSRVPTELVFDQGLGDLFVVRVAGNCLSLATKASLQFAVHALKVKVLVVMGHEFCGAIKAAQLPSEQLDRDMPEELAQALKGLKVGLNEEVLRSVQDGRAKDREAVVANVKQQVKLLTEDAGIMGKVKSKELLIAGAMYEISSGIVDFFQEIEG